MELTGRDVLAFLVIVGKSNAHAVDCHDGMHPTLSCLRSLGMMLFLSIGSKKMRRCQVLISLTLRNTMMNPFMTEILLRFTSQPPVSEKARNESTSGSNPHK